jgi:hypothetical protein
MSYSPAIGRFLEEDPIGILAEQPEALGIGADTSEKILMESGGDSNSTVTAIQEAVDKTINKFGLEAVISNIRLIQYTDGASTYEYESSDPINSTDSAGLDRYVVDGGFGHHGIAVDQWSVVNGQWVKTGVVTYDFSLNYWYIWAGATQIAGLPAGGKVRQTCGINGKVQSTVVSSPQADLALQANLDAAVINPPLYSLAYYNCNWFVQNHLLDGINTGPTPPGPARPGNKAGPTTAPSGK